MKWQNTRLILGIIVVISILSAFAVEPGLASNNASQFQSNFENAASSALTLQGASYNRIRFATGATSAVVSGNLAASSTSRYILTARAGQLMNVDLSAPEGAKLIVTTYRGRALTPLTSSSTSFRGYLPWNGDYILAISSPSQSISYSLSVSIPVRIAFAKGATSATLTGSLQPHQGLDYILGASANQLLEIDTTPDSNLQLIIYGVDGTVLRSGNAQGASFRGRLPLSEDYIVSLRAGDQAVSFSMQVIIPQRISFKPGATSATVQYSLKANQSQYFVLRANANQNMQVKLNPGDASQLVIYGADGTVLKNGSSGDGNYSGTLPSSQDYVVAVKAGSNPVSFTVKFIIK